MLKITVTGASELRARIRQAARDLRTEEMPRAVNGLTEAAAEQAKFLIGRENFWWAPLARSTVRQKARLGYVGRISVTDPVYRTGKTRESIRAMSVGSVGIIEGNDAAEDLGDARTTGSLGLRSIIARWQFLGTKTIPAERTLLPALQMTVRDGIMALAAAWERAWR